MDAAIALIALDSEFDALFLELLDCTPERADEIFGRLTEIEKEMDWASDAHDEFTHGAVSHCADIF